MSSSGDLVEELGEASSKKSSKLRLTLVRDVDTQDMSENLEKGFRRSAGQTYPKLAARFERIESWIPILEEGDRFVVTYRLGTGVEVRHGEKLLGRIDGSDFATTLFSIWLGEHPPNAGLGRGLLGGPCG